MAFESVRAAITSDKEVSDKLIFAASLSRSPVVPVLDCLSEPAKSTKLNFPTLKDEDLESVPIIISIVMVNIVCERLDSLFILVEAITLCFSPIFRNLSKSETLLTT